MKITTNQDRLCELFDADPRNDTAIALELNVSKQALSAWRNGTRSPKKPVLIKIAQMYNVSLEWLMVLMFRKAAFIRNLPTYQQSIMILRSTPCLP